MDYITFGNGNKKLVILPGIAIKSVLPMKAAIEAQYKIFSNEYKVYLIDRRRDADESYTIFDMAEDTAKKMKELNLEGAYIFGASQGGILAQLIAINHPELTGKILLGSTTSHSTPESDKVFVEWIELAKTKDVKGLVTSMCRKVYSKELVDANLDAYIAAFGDTTDADLRNFAIQAKDCMEFSIHEDLGRIKCPVFVIGVRDDAIFGVKASEEIADKLGCPIHIYEKYAHSAFDEAPDYTERMYNFFNSPIQ